MATTYDGHVVLSPEQLESHARAYPFIGEGLPERDPVQSAGAELGRCEHHRDPLPLYLRFTPLAVLPASSPTPVASILHPIPFSNPNQLRILSDERAPDHAPRTRATDSRTYTTSYQAPATLSGFVELMSLVMSSVPAPPSTPSDEIPSFALSTSRFGIAELTHSLMHPGFKPPSQAHPVYPAAPSQKHTSRGADKDHTEMEVNRWLDHAHSNRVDPRSS